MLVLTRKKDETVVLFDRETGREILTVFVCEVRGDKVRLGFNADNSVVIVRSELIQVSDPTTEVVREHN